MPKCILCNKSQSALNEGNLCKQCFRKPADSSQSENDEPFISLSKEALRDLIQKELEPLTKRITDLESMNKSLSTELKLLKNRNKTDNNDRSDNQIKECSDNLKTIKATVAAQQKTLEDLQQDRRAKNLIITGVPEAPGEPSDTRRIDFNTVESIFTAVECPGICANRVTRLGKKQETPLENSDISPTPRPLLVCLNTTNDARTIIKKSSNLKKSSDFKKVYIKKDEHPLVRKEWRRLRDFARKEKAAPINVGCTIKVDYQRRAVTRDGETILEFVSPFRSTGPNQSE